MIAFPGIVSARAGGYTRSGLVREYLGDNAPSGAVAAWPDTALGKDATQASGGSQPVSQDGVLNGHRVVLFDGVNDFLDFDPIAVTAQSIFAVAGPNENGLSFFGGTGGAQFSGTLGGNSLYLNSDSQNLLPVNYTGSGYNIFAQVNGLTCDQFFNGTLIGTGVQRATSTWQRVGTRGNDLFCNGIIAALLLYDRAVSGTERAEILAILGARYGITITP